uniref:ATP-binding protein n=1 Tax=Euplotes harpa TaxID=151035 RepID=A0A7S3N2P0_9SPIT
MEALEEPKFKYCFIMRGVPGSGKSTVAKRIKGEEGVVHTTDNYFLNENGEYVFDRDLLAENHKKNFQAFCKSIDEGVESVIVDNTNTTEREYKRYQEYATEHGYVVSFVVIPHIPASVAAARNSHGVPEEAIKNMLKRWWKM